jgi:TRAP-type C4-dicarboxylate transport system permease small subunit
MERVLDRLYWVFRVVILDGIVGYGAAIVLLGSTLLAIYEIIRRYILGVVFDWGQDAVTYFTVGSIFLYFAVTQVRRSHLAVTLLIDRLRESGREKVALSLRLIITVCSIALYGALALWGIPTVERSEMLARTTQSMILYIWPFQLLLIIGFAFMAISSLFHLYQDIQALRGRKVFAWAPSEEGLDV